MSPLHLVEDFTNGLEQPDGPIANSKRLSILPVPPKYSKGRLGYTGANAAGSLAEGPANDECL